MFFYKPAEVSSLFIIEKDSLDLLIEKVMVSPNNLKKKKKEKEAEEKKKSVKIC